MPTPLDRLIYRTSQSARTAWYTGQKLLAARLTTPEPAPPELKGRFPGRDKLLADMRRLRERDLANIEAGLYSLPADIADSPIDALRTARSFFADIASVEARRRQRQWREIPPTVDDGRYPAYYLQNFHHQTDGWLSERSAALYDHQVEVLFGGTADAMRRQALLPLGEAIQAAALDGRRQRDLRLMDVACGTGRFLREIKNNYPRLPVTAFDLSPFYLDRARELLAPWSWTRFVAGAAEAMPEPDASFDILTCVYLFHELPPDIRRRAAAEMARVLKPGGTLIFVDSLQLGDDPDYDGMLRYFPVGFHEPYFAHYIQDDLDGLFAAAGLTRVALDLAYFSRVATYRRDA